MRAVTLRGIPLEPQFAAHAPAMFELLRRARADERLCGLPAG